jgi:hypothetical protein
VPLEAGAEVGLDVVLELALDAVPDVVLGVEPAAAPDVERLPYRPRSPEPPTRWLDSDSLPYRSLGSLPP